MIEIDLGDFGGGKKHFEHLDSLLATADGERDKWTNDPPYRHEIQNRHDDIATGLRDIPGRWQDLRNTITNLQAQGLNDDQLAQQLSGHLKSNKVISFSSHAGNIIRECSESIDIDGALGASQFFRLGSNAQLPNPMRKSQYDGYLYAWSRYNALDSRSAASSRASLRRTLDEMENRERSHHEQLLQTEEQLQITLNLLNAQKDDQRDNFSKLTSGFEEVISTDRARWTEEWNQQRELFVEQLKLRAAVSQWGDRATDHENAFKTQRKWTISVGLSGLVGAILWSWLALDVAKWLFSDALAASSSIKSATNSLRPTWPHEIIFSASAALLYLTLFLWSMRILVRMMMSEHHLGIDARSRQSMAHTYLALIETDAASDADRAIVLAALFRPVTDGLVKDDALPLISPATVLSSVFAGK